MKFKEMPYKRVDYGKAEKQILTLTERVKNAKNGEELWAIHQEYYDVYKNIKDTMTIAMIRHNGDTTDEFYLGEQHCYDEMSPKLSNLFNGYQKALYESPYRSYMEEKIGKVAFVTMENSIKSMNENIIGLMQEENVLCTQYNNLIASAKLNFDGKELNLSLLRPYLTNSDREVRRQAWKVYSEYFLSIADDLDEIFDKLVKNRTAQAKAMGYENFVDLGYCRMNRNSYGKEEVENFRKQVKEVFVPFAEKVQEKRRVRLGLDKLSCIDNEVYFLNGNPAPVGTPEEILQSGQKMYEELSSETKEFFDFMMECELFDVFGRKNKKQGGYMTYIHKYNAPFIFANFNGTSGDVDVITHECGHAFQGFLSGKDPILEHSDITMETAEIHSMSMEFFTNPWMKAFFGDRADDFLLMQLEDAVRFIPYGTMVDEFQHIIYEKPELTPAERRQAWRNLERVYMPHLDYEGHPFFENGGFWQKQHHIYNMPFYYIDYVLAQTCAFQYKVWMDQNYQEAWDSYLKLCKISASEFYGDMLKNAGLKVPFEDGYFNELVKYLEEKVR